jgi:hypothetical protein
VVLWSPLKPDLLAAFIKIFNRAMIPRFFFISFPQTGIKNDLSTAMTSSRPTLSKRLFQP